MAKSVACPGCKARIPIDESHYGQTLECKCGKKFRIGQPAQQPAAKPANAPQPVAQKQVAKPVAKPVTKDAPKPPVTPVAKQAAKPAAKPSAAPAAKPGGKPTAMPPVIPGAASAGKPIAKPASKSRPPADDLGSNSLFDEDLEGSAPALGSSASTTLQPVGKSRGRAKKFRSSRGTSLSYESNLLARIGMYTAFCGIGCLLLPLVGLQIKPLLLLGLDKPYVGAILSCVAAGLLFASQAGTSPLMGLLLGGGTLGALGIAWLITQAGGGGDGVAPGQPQPPANQQAGKQPRAPQNNPAPNPGPTVPTPATPRPNIPVVGRMENQEIATALPHSDMTGGPGGARFEIADADLRPVVGFLYSRGVFDNQTTLAEFWPLYDRAVAAAASSEWVVVAKEGYVVGGLNVRADKYVNAVQVVFVRFDGQNIIPTDRYESPWIGEANAMPIKILAGQGQMVLGAFGSKGLILNSLGLITLE